MAFGRGGLESGKVLPCRQTARAPANPSFELPLPLLVEQKEIVRSVKALFALGQDTEELPITIVFLDPERRLPIFVRRVA